MKKIMIDVYNQNGRKIKDKLELDRDIFGVKAKDVLVKQVLSVQRANSRQLSAHTKGRSEVRGGGRKPWRQKGTGRARHGSIRSPLWRGGGVTFGPNKDRNYTKRLNKAMKQLALKSVLSSKVVEGNLKVIDKVILKEAKTKEAVELVKSFKLEGYNVLAVGKLDKKLVLATRNLSELDLVGPQNLNVRDCLKSRKLLITKTGIKQLSERLGAKD